MLIIMATVMVKDMLMMIRLYSYDGVKITITSVFKTNNLLIIIIIIHPYQER